MPEFQSLFPQSRAAELTLRALAAGPRFCIIFAAVTVYVGLPLDSRLLPRYNFRVVDQHSARIRGGASILENNIVQTTETRASSY